ncbi:hypothetical protein LTR10_013340 [Elasticomyces elasticus]|uniref:Zn(2)-C6 fungal-type domain-containing protein n=1 Tax=Exophiala sideris TaxID=1016849 RepID=A0ABR0J531_9EURO|nr:hypothetical protein LTR10_013340 [Elasticomyces elasticus]KAK5027431.1 hypothetical protein LTS07_007033 [Exophiala sideris]KAK5034867.1 hypothetical protein LTR13_006049 [Exophiala sideris]KAK5056399.1 hypothetical protein LTR69_007940 [Exophiala sideris]KAK5181112.1 hypothetical protein LTR44_006443 [Eurotiomycetes sp. CCFEE 6388]
MVPRARQPSLYSDADDNDDEDFPYAKRQRVSAACDQCRSRKVKCDATKPVCGPCITRYGPFPTCEWGVRRGRGAAIANKDEILRLSKRVEELERDRQPANDANSPEHTLTPRPVMLADDDVAPESNSCRSPVASPDSPREQDIENSAMLGFTDVGNRPIVHHYNDSSVTSFMNQIKSLIEQETTPPEVQGNTTSSRAILPKMNSRKTSSMRQLPNYVLPSRQRADHLLLVYCRMVATLYPFLDLDEVDMLYQRLWTGQDLGEDGLTFLCLINVVFSIACNLDPSTLPNERVSNAEVFYSRAEELLQTDIVQHRSLLAVQCFLLLGQYLQSTNDPEQCWIYVGFAVRIAQSLRLDIPSTSSRQPVRQKELCRRVWHGCILMDQTISMTFGRPPMITSQAAALVPLPAAHLGDLECRCFSEHAYESSDVDFHFFIETLKLYILMNETISTFYNSESKEDFTGNLNFVYFGILGAKAIGSLLEIDHKLSHWNDSLPIRLRHNAASNSPSSQRRQSNVLFVRYCHVRILLFRPVLARYCSRAATQSLGTESVDCLPTKIALQFSVACIKAAFRSIECFDTAMSGKEVEKLDEILPAWWYGIFYVYNAATVLVAARLNATLLAEVTEREVLRSWAAVTRILARYEAFSKHAKRCSTALKLLSNQVEQYGQQRGTLSAQGSVANAEPRVSSTLDSGEMVALSDSTRSVVTAIHTQDWARTPTGLSLSGREDPLVHDVISHFNTAGIEVDIFGDMSWLTSMPSQLY